jgi:GntR family transcriptional regulator, transcriptional repressor for pyruvate dehydrogenase complex
MKTEFTTTTLADQVEDKILEYIKKNHLSLGDSLPNEMEFVEMLGISRNVVREAMSRLRMLGLIQTRQKRGIVITEPPLLNGLKKVLDPNLLSIKTIKEMMGMRIALEIGITDFIFTNVTEKDINELEQIVSRQQAIGVNNLSIADEMLFHTKIYEIAGNKFILQFNEIMHPIFVFAKQNYESHFQPINKKLNEQGKIISHFELLKLIKEGKKEEYQNAMKAHLQPYWEFLYNYENIL